MTEQSNADLIALIVKKVEQIREQGLASPYVHQIPKEGNWGYVQTLWPVAVAVGVLSDALEAAEQRAEEAERERDRLDEAFDRDLPWRYDEVEAQRNQYAAVVEKVRDVASSQVARSSVLLAVIREIAAVPADLLREVKAEAHDQGYRQAWRDVTGVEHTEYIPSQYRDEEQQ